MNNGKVFRLYTEESYNKLPDQIPPEIQRSDLATTVLYLKGNENLFVFEISMKNVKPLLILKIYFQR